MLQIKNLTMTHKKDNRLLLEGFHLTVQAGDKTAIIGEEGNGKSTLLKLIYDEKLVEDYIDYSGEIICNQLRFGYLAQELTEEEKAESVYEFMCRMPLFFEAAPKELAEISHNLKMETELFYGEQEMGKLSGGEKIKVQLARILLSRPDMLLLDEPSNDLDMDTLLWLEQFIKECELPVLYISHDEVLLENTANRIVHIEQLKRKMQARAAVVKSSYADYIKHRAAGLEKTEQLARKERSEYQKQQEKFLQIRQRVEHEQNVISRQNPAGGRLLKKHMHRIKAYEARFEKAYEQMTEMPETEDAIFIKFGERVKIPNGKVVLEYYLPELRAGERILAKQIALNIKGPEKVCIIGKNGCGKTTLLRKIAAEMNARKDIKVSYMPQNYEELLDMEQTPVEFLSETGDKDEISKIRTCLGSMKYTADEMGHRIADLSGGQKAKLLFLKMSLAGSDVLILDEPTRNISPLSNPVIREMLSGYGGAVLTVSHDRKYIKEVATKVYELTEQGLALREER